MFKCKICEEKFETKRALATHLQKVHKMSTKDYTIEFLYENEQPMCPVCGEETRYVSFSFKKYCKGHSSHAESEAGRIGGIIKKTWSKGKTKEDNEILKKTSERFTGEGNPFFGKKHTEESIHKMKKNSMLSKKEFQERIDSRSDDFIVKTEYGEYRSRQKQLLQVICKKCDKEDYKSLSNLENGSRCKYCFPLGKGSSFQNEIEQFLKENDIVFIENDRKTIAPKELDILIEKEKFAIEFNGIYWHSELHKERKYHKNKTIECDEKGIQLFHIFSDEWVSKQEILKSMILHRVKKTKRKIYARKCVVKKVPKKYMKVFFNNTHISGNVNAKECFGLYYKDELVACLSLRKPFHKKYKNYLEIARFSTALNTTVIGGLGKLLKVSETYAKELLLEGLLTYADLRFGKGDGYKKVGFELKGDTGIDYWYTDGKTRFNRFKFRASDGKTERQIVEEYGVYRVHGCGSNIYILKL